MTEVSEHNPPSVVDLFRVKLEDMTNQDTIYRFAKVVDSFGQFIGGTPVTVEDFNEHLLCEWVSWLFLRGYAYTTVAHHVNKLGALYGKLLKDGQASDKDLFPRLKAKLAAVSPHGVEINSDKQCFSKLRRLVHLDCSTNPPKQLAKDIVLFAIYNGGMTFEKIGNFKKDDYRGNDAAIIEIVERYSKPKNKYLFPLNQSELTPKQLRGRISGLFSDALKTVNIDLREYTPAIAIDLWAIAAAKCNISASDIASCVDTPEFTNPGFSFAHTTEMPSERREDIRRYVSRILSKNPENWYAMQFRPYVKIDMVKKRLQDKDIRFKDTYYPMEEIYRRTGKKIIKETKPVVPGLLFFRCKATEVSEVFYNIGDLAWGYRQTRNVRSPYAVINEKAIMDYRNAIGTLTDGMDVYLDGTIELQEGDYVEIIGGAFCGLPAIIDKIKRQNKQSDIKRIVYKLNLMGNNNIEWAVNIDPHLLHKITPLRYHTLLTP